MSAGCINAPCTFGCTSVGSAGYSCGCPQGYQRIGQGHCLSTVTPATAVGYEDDIGDVPTYPISGYRAATGEKIITTEGCFSCKVSTMIKYHIYCYKIFLQQINGRHRRDSKRRKLNNLKNHNATEIWHQLLRRSHKRLRRQRRHHHGEELELKLNLEQTRHKTRIVKLQPSVKVKIQISKIKTYCKSQIFRFYLLIINTTNKA